MTNVLLQTKLYIPRVAPDRILRPRLLSRLDDALHTRLALISAPAGFGKTTLVAQWLAQRGGLADEGEGDGPAVAWLSLDEADDDAARFFSYLRASLARALPGLAAGDAAAGQLPPQTWAAQLINEVAALPRDLLLIVDDYHLITTAAVHNTMAFLLDHMPPSLHLLILTRADPPLPLARLRAHGDVVELRARDLRFSHEEVAAFVRQAIGDDVAPATVAALDRRTEGWVAGLQLAAHSLQMQPEPEGFLEAFAGDDRYVADYLVQEVLGQQPAPIKRFLLKTSILTRLSGPLCDAVLADEAAGDGAESAVRGQEILEQLEAANLFIVPLDNRRQWYRYHHLFADLLRERLEESDADLAALHLRACAWYEAEELLVPAVRHAVAAGAVDRALDLIARAAPEMFKQSQLETMIRWWGALPEAAILRRPRLAMIYAWAWLATGQPQRAESCTGAVEEAIGVRLADAVDGRLDLDALPPQSRTALAEVAVVRISLLMDRLQLEEAQRLARWALTALSPGVAGLFNRAEDLRPVVLFDLGLANRFAGNLDEAVPALREAAESARPLGNIHIVALAMGHLSGVLRQQGRLHEAVATAYQGVADVTAMAGRLSPMAAMLHGELGNLAYERNELEEAGARWRKAVALAQPWSNWEGLVPAHLGLARLLRARGERHAALAELAALEETLAHHTELLEPRVTAWRALLWAESGDVTTAQHWRRKADAALADEPPPLREEASLLLAHAYLALGDVAAAEALATEQRRAAEAGGRWGHVIPLLVVEAVALAATERRELALSRLERALVLGRPQQFVRAFVDVGTPLAPLLYEAAAREAAGEYAAALLALLPGAVPPSPPAAAPEAPEGLIEPLSEREVEVLQLIARGMTNQEIGQRLHLAVGTVKAHAHNIYGKLQVGNRTEAVSQARLLGLLPPE